LSEAQETYAGARESKKAADDSVDMGNRELGKADEYLKKRIQAAKEQQTVWELSVQASEAAQDEAKRTLDKQTAWTIKLGQTQADSAKIDVEYQLAERKRVDALSKFEAAQAKAYSALETATKEEADASAAVTVAHGMLARAKALADKVPLEAVPIAPGPAR